MAYTHAMLAFHWSQLTPTHCLIFFDHSLHPHNAYFSMTMVYTHAMLVLNWSQLTPMHCLFFIGHGLYPCIAFFSSIHFVDFIYGQMYQSTTSAGFIVGQGDILHNVSVHYHDTTYYKLNYFTIFETK